MITLIAFPFSFKMTLAPTPSPTPTPTSDAIELANMKRKYTAIEAQHARRLLCPAEYPWDNIE